MKSSRPGILATILCIVSAASAQTPAPQAAPPRPTPPTRAVDGPGAPPFTKIPAGNPPADQEGNFVIGPEYTAPPALTGTSGVPVGKVMQFMMESTASKFYPG